VAAYLSKPLFVFKIFAVLAALAMVGTLLVMAGFLLSHVDVKWKAGMVFVGGIWIFITGVAAFAVVVGIKQLFKSWPWLAKPYIDFSASEIVYVEDYQRLVRVRFSDISMIDFEAPQRGSFLVLHMKDGSVVTIGLSELAQSKDEIFTELQLRIVGASVPRVVHRLILPT